MTGSTAKGVDLFDLEAQNVVMSRNSGPSGGYAGRVPMFGDVALNRAHVKSDLLMIGAAAGAVDATSADIGGEMNFTDAHLGTVSIAGARIAGDCSFAGATAANVDGIGADVGKELAFTESVGTARPSFGDINISGARLGALEVRKVTTGSIVAQSASIGHDVLIGDASVRALDLTSSKVDGTLFLITHKAPLFRDGGSFVLRNASVRTFEDRPGRCSGFGAGCPDPWPRGCDSAGAAGCTRLDLNGFTYGSLASAGRTIEWWQNWLRRASFAPQPYRQMASTLQSVGRPEDAVAIEVAGKDRELETASFGRKAFLLVDKFLVGYGYHPGYAAVWAALLVAAGLVVVLRSGQQEQLRHDPEPLTVSALIYSFDTLIPFVTLRKTDAEIEFRGWAGYYLFGHKIAGYVLAGFLAAGLSGLTK